MLQAAAAAKWFWHVQEQAVRDAGMANLEGNVRLVGREGYQCLSPQVSHDAHAQIHASSYCPLQACVRVCQCVREREAYQGKFF